MIDINEYNEYLQMDGRERGDLTQLDIELLEEILKEEVYYVIV